MIDIDTVAQYICWYIAIQVGCRCMNPVSLKKVYLPGINEQFKLDRISNNFGPAIKSDEVKAVLGGFFKIYDRMHPYAERMKIAFGVDMALKSPAVMQRERWYQKHGADQEIMQRRMFVVMCVGIYFMLRKGEHICKKNGAPAGLTREKIVFLGEDGEMIAYNNIGRAGFEARKVCIPTSFSKTDHSGFGRRPWHMRQDDPRKADVCIVQILEKWIATTRDIYGATEEQELYELPGLPAVSIKDLHEIMTSTVLETTNGRKIPRKATSHSLRYGGATMLAQAGFPQYLIAHYGGWTADSEALKRYVVPSEESIKKVSEYMTSMALENPSRHYIEDAMAVWSERQKKSSKGGKTKR